MAQRQFVSRHGHLVNRAHLDREVPYRYQCDPVRYLARWRANQEEVNKHLDIQAGLEDYYQDNQ